MGVDDFMGAGKHRALSVSDSATQPPRIAVIPERYGQVFSPCASIRLQSFFDAMRRVGDVQVRYLLPSEIRRYRPDVIVWHRVSLADVAQVDQLAEDAAHIGARLVYDLDDNLLDLAEHGERASYAGKIAAVRRSLAIADEIWCSSPRLVQRVRSETRATIQVLPNSLDPDLWTREAIHVPLSPSISSPLRLLYMGTQTHDADFALLARALDNLHRDNPGSFQLTLIGVRAAETVSTPWLRVLSPPQHVGASYPAFVHWFSRLRGFDLGVAPLLEGNFNDCKSPIKVLDYAAIGLPTLASNVPAYAHALMDGVDCHLVDNDVDAWASAVRTLSQHRERLTAVVPGAAYLVRAEAFVQAVEARLSRLLAASSDLDRRTAVSR